MIGPKIAVADIETTPIVSYTWGLFDQTVGLNQIDTEWSIMSFAVKPLGAPTSDLEYMDTSKRDDMRDDSELAARLWEIIHEYDFIVAQNGKRFDLRKIMARLIMLGFPPPSPTKVLDTLLMAKQVAAFTSNKLEWLGPHVGGIPKNQHKDFPGFELWLECMRGNPKAWKALREYNVPDILACEAVYMRLRPFTVGHPNVAVYHTEDNKVQCPVCGGHHVERDGYAFTNTGQYNRYHCEDCGAWSRDRYTINSTAKRRALLTASA